MPAGRRVQVDVYGAAGCSLCGPAREAVARVVRELVEARGPVPVDVRHIAIDGDAELEARYRLELPVVEVDGRKAAKYAVDEDLLLARLVRALDG